MLNASDAQEVLLSKQNDSPAEGGFTRRSFLKGVGAGTGALGAGLLSPTETLAQAGKLHPDGVQGPEAAPVTLRVNGQAHKLELEPRVTLLDALRNHLDMTGAKKVCDRGSCGACTVHLDGKPVYSCTMLAIEAQGHDITTIEGLGSEEDLSPVMAAFVEHDAQQCGFCTPGFVMAATAYLQKHPHASLEEVEKGLCGNLCRCGTYVGMREAVLEAARTLSGGKKHGVV